MLATQLNRVNYGRSVFYFGKNTFSLFSYSLVVCRKVVSQQSEQCVFRCVASCSALFVFYSLKGNTIMKKHFTLKRPVLSALFALLLAVVCAIGAHATFDDAVGTPYQAAIDELAELKLALGVSDTRFGVDEPVTRQQMTLFMARLLTGNAITGLEAAENTTTFTDLTDPTYYRSISYCYAQKLIVGRDETTFDPTGNVSVQEAITIAVRALGYSDLDYPDGYIATAKHFGLLTNLENVNYTAPMTRGQVAQLLCNTLHNINMAGEYGKSLYDAKFSKNPKKGYFEITTLDELKANYKYTAAKYNLRDGYDSYIVEDVTFMGYTGDIQYYFPKDETTPYKYCIVFQFTITGEQKNRGPHIWIENSSHKLTAAEAKALLDPINLRMAFFAERPLAEYRASAIRKDGAPSDIYKATVDGFQSLIVDYQEKDGSKNLPKGWILSISTRDCTSFADGYILNGLIEYNEFN